MGMIVMCTIGPHEISYAGFLLIYTKHSNRATLAIENHGKEVIELEAPNTFLLLEEAKKHLSKKTIDELTKRICSNLGTKEKCITYDTKEENK